MATNIKICNICLQDKINLRSIINPELENFYDELCDYSNGPNSILCSECLYKLKKCFEFRKCCNLANNTLKEWAKEHKTKRKPKYLLHTKMSPPQLSLCNKSNFKVYFYQTADVDVTASIQMPTSKYPHIVTVNIPRDKDIEDFGQMNTVTNDEQVNVLNTEVKLEFELDLDKRISQEINGISHNSEYNIITQPLKNIPDDKVNNNADSENYDRISNEAVHSDSDESIKELETLIANLKKKQETLSDKDTVNKPKKKTKYKIKPVNVEELKAGLKKKFETCGTIKDDQGNVIDKDIVLNNLHKMAHLRSIKNLCLVPGPFSQLAIRKLSEIQKRFGDTSIYETICLGTHEEMVAEFEKRRENSSYVKNPHRCESCLLGFMNHALLDYHIKFSHNPALPYECLICHTRKRTKLRLAHHRLTHKNVLKCKLCTFTTGTRSVMTSHANKHKGVTYKCKICEKRYRSNASLAVHMNREHGTKYACVLCAAAFRTQPAVKLHHVKKHLGEQFVQSEDNTKCEECDVLFVSRDVYERHMKVTHKVRQSKLHTLRAKMVYSCRLCDWVGSGRLLQMDHYQSEHPDADPAILQNRYKYLCHDCGRRFQSKEKYTEHTNRHSGVRPYSCNVCSKTFYSRVGHQNHMLRHQPPSKECPHCGKKLTTASALGVHIRIHTNDRRYKCNVCGKGFLFNGALRQHVSGVHYSIKRIRKPRQKDINDDRSL